MARSSPKEKRSPLGQAWLRRELQLPVPRPFVESHRVASGTRRREVDGPRTLELYPHRYAVGRSVVSHLRFALRHEALDLGVLAGAFAAMDASELESWVRKEPTGTFSRRAWFLYETLTGRTLDLEDARRGNYVEALDSRRHVVASRRNSRRHRVVDNLLGGRELCVTVRRTEALEAAMAERTDLRLRRLLAACDPAVLDRAVNYLYTKESRASFAIEGERPSAGRTERFATALKRASAFDATDEAALTALQNTIVDPRYAASGWRSAQTFVGGVGTGFREKVHFVCPRPSDLPGLMEGWAALHRRVVEGGVPPVVAAAASAFAFVFAHPFDDGNGRIHRFLIHQVLAQTGYVPAGAVFPVSAAILRDRRSYDGVLESFSRPRLALTEWRWTPEKKMVVENDTANLYRHFDATPFAEYLHERVAETVRTDMKEEIDFIAVFDRAFDAVRAVVDMPDRRASLLVRLCMQNNGVLPRRRRRSFPELADEEIGAMEDAVRRAMDHVEVAHAESADSLAATQVD